MEGRLKYRPSKTQITLAETKELLKAYANENKKMRQVLSEAESALKFARDKLIEKEEENRQLKLIILRMTEQEERDARHGSPSALEH
jgi:hypothetical protein